MAYETNKSVVSSQEFIEKRRQISKALIKGLQFPPLSKKDMYLILNEIKEMFPELEALRAPMAKLPGEISRPWFEMLPIYTVFRTVESKLKKKPFHPARAMDALRTYYGLP